MTKKVISGITHALSLMTKRKSSYDRYFQKGNKTDVRSYLKKRYEFLPELPRMTWTTLGKISKKGLKVLVSKMDNRIARSFTDKQINDRLNHVDAVRASVGLRPCRRNTRLVIQELYHRKTPATLPVRYNVRPARRMVEDPENPDFLAEDIQLSITYRIRKPRICVPTKRSDITNLAMLRMATAGQILTTDRYSDHMRDTYARAGITVREANPVSNQSTLGLTQQALLDLKYKVKDDMPYLEKNQTTLYTVLGQVSGSSKMKIVHMGEEDTNYVQPPKLSGNPMWVKRPKSPRSQDRDRETWDLLMSLPESERIPKVKFWIDRLDDDLYDEVIEQSHYDSETTRLEGVLKELKR